MKTTGRCPKCDHGRILYVACVADRYGQHSTSDSTVPMRIAHYRQEHAKFLGFPITSSASSGELEAGVCRQCGYTEFYTKNPQHIVIDGKYVRELVAPEPGYRKR